MYVVCSIYVKEQVFFQCERRTVVVFPFLTETSYDVSNIRGRI